MWLKRIWWNCRALGGWIIRRISPRLRWMWQQALVLISDSWHSVVVGACDNTLDPLWWCISRNSLFPLAQYQYWYLLHFPSYNFSTSPLERKRNMVWKFCFLNYNMSSIFFQTSKPLLHYFWCTFKCDTWACPVQREMQLVLMGIVLIWPLGLSNVMPSSHHQSTKPFFEKKTTIIFY